MSYGFYTSFDTPKVGKKPPCEPDHWMINRIPKNDFLMANAATPNKFVDDHFFFLGPEKQCSNSLRRMRFHDFHDFEVGIIQKWLFLSFLGTFHSILGLENTSEHFEQDTK